MEELGEIWTIGKFWSNEINSEKFGQNCCMCIATIISSLRRNGNGHLDRKFAHGHENSSCGIGDSPWAIFFPWYKRYRENQCLQFT